MTKERTVSRFAIGLCLIITTLVSIPVSTMSAATFNARSTQSLVVLPDQVLPSRVLSHLQKVGDLSPQSSFELNFGLPLRAQGELESFISTNAEHGHYLSEVQFRARYSPTRDQVNRVTTWLRDHGYRVNYISPDNLSITARATAQVIDTTLHVGMRRYRTRGGIVFDSANRNPSVPTGLGLQSISGLSTYLPIHTDVGERGPGRRQLGTHAEALGTGPNRLYRPADFQGLYDVAGHGIDGTGQTIGIIDPGTQVSDADLKIFATKTGDVPLKAGSGADQVAWIRVGNTGPTTPLTQEEVAMDVEYAHGMAPHSHIKTWLFECAVKGQTCAAQQGLFTTSSVTSLENAVSMAANDPSVRIISNSWGVPEVTHQFVSITDDGYTNLLSGSFYSQTTNSFMHAVSVGKTFYFSTGDDGANSGCVGAINPVTTTQETSTCRLPSYPADSPYVVAVGGTSLFASRSRAYQNELGWDGSGGGCSTATRPLGGLVLPRPSWQVGITAASCTSGRAIPDLAADADPRTGAYVYPSVEPGSGTSLATPLVAGMAADTDRYLQEHNLSPVGWAAPTIYQLANSSQYHQVFHDILQGYNGFSAGAGWDEVTGWGSLDWYQFAFRIASKRTARNGLVVTTTGDAAPPCKPGAYSLRCAITKANSDGSGDTINFNIPSTDPGCKPATIQGKAVKMCTISPTTQLPTLTASNTTVNGYGQSGAQANTNPLQAGDNAILTVRLDGSKVRAVDGLRVSGSGDTIKGLSITGFSPVFDGTHHPFAISCSGPGSSMIVAGNFIGVAPDGKAAPNLNGVLASGGCRATIGGTSALQANLLSANTFESIWLSGFGDVVQGNLVGTDPTGTKGISPTTNGIDLYATTNAVVGGSQSGAGNVISGNWMGVVDAYHGSTDSLIQGNLIGTNAAGAAVGNAAYGIWVAGTSTKGRIVGNTIAYDGVGVFVGSGGCGGASGTPHVAISQNSIYGNGGHAVCGGRGGLGIDLAPQGVVNCSTWQPGPNDYTLCPVIQTATTSQVSGTACAGCTVEVFIATNDSDDQSQGEGKTYLGSTMAHLSGKWQLSGLLLNAGQQVTATATTPSLPGPAETSEFAANVKLGGAIKIISSPSPGAGDNILYAVSAVSDNDVWAVGEYCTTPPSECRTLTEHWNGSGWSVVPSPNPDPLGSSLLAVTAVASNDVWAVGPSGPDDGQQSHGPLILHWDGSTWKVVANPLRNQGVLYAITAISATDIWAVGYYYAANVSQKRPAIMLTAHSLTEHWNGSSWSVVPAPDTGVLRSISGTSSNDLWTVGGQVIQHWDGSAWRIVPSPHSPNNTADDMLLGVRVLAPNDAWAVGYYVDYSTGSAVEGSLIEHWNGSSWSIAPSPSVESAYGLNSITSVSANGLWAVGQAPGLAPLIVHWDGSTWNVVTIPKVEAVATLLAVAAVPDTGHWWAVGYEAMSAGSPLTTLTEFCC